MSNPDGRLHGRSFLQPGRINRRTDGCLIQSSLKTCQLVVTHSRRSSAKRLVAPSFTASTATLVKDPDCIQVRITGLGNHSMFSIYYIFSISFFIFALLFLLFDLRRDNALLQSFIGPAA